MRGRKQFAQSCYFAQARVEIYPREGTETLFSHNARLYKAVEIYPREGTETLAVSFQFLIYHQVEIYPCEGTETLNDCQSKSSNRLKFIPVRGRKLNRQPRALTLSLVEIYPREGTETCFTA